MVGVLCVPCSSLLYMLLVTIFFCLQLFFLYSVPVFQFSSSSYLCLFGFVPVLLLPRLPLLCLVVGSSGCVSSYDFVVGGSSYFIFLCFGCFLLDFFRGFTYCFRFLYSSPLGRVSLRSGCVGAVSLFHNFTCLIITPCWSLLLQLGVSTLQGGGGCLLFVASSPDSS